MPSFRDRFFTRKVSTAMMSPLAIVSAGGGAAAGILVGGAIAGPFAIVGGIVGAAVAWAIRVGVAIPRSPEQSHVDPYTVAEPWRRLTQDAIAARRQFEEAVRRSRSGPLRDRLATIGTRIDAGIDEVWATAQAGNALTDAYQRIDQKSARRELDELKQSSGQFGPNATTKATVDALTAQIETADRMSKMIEDTEAQLKLLNARLDESVAQCVELSVGTFKPDELTQVEDTVKSINDELGALRGAVEETSAIGGTAAPTPTPSPGAG